MTTEDITEEREKKQETQKETPIATSYFIQYEPVDPPQSPFVTLLHSPGIYMITTPQGVVLNRSWHSIVWFYNELVNNMKECGIVVPPLKQGNNGLFPMSTKWIDVWLNTIVIHPLIIQNEMFRTVYEAFIQGNIPSIVPTPTGDVPKTGQNTYYNNDAEIVFMDTYYNLFQQEQDIRRVKEILQCEEREYQNLYGMYQKLGVVFSGMKELAYLPFVFERLREMGEIMVAKHRGIEETLEYWREYNELVMIRLQERSELLKSYEQSCRETLKKTQWHNKIKQSKEDGRIRVRMVESQAELNVAQKRENEIKVIVKKQTGILRHELQVFHDIKEQQVKRDVLNWAREQREKERKVLEHLLMVQDLLK